MLRKIKISLITIVILGIFFSGIGFAQNTLWEGVSQRSVDAARMPGLVPSGEKLKPVLFGFDMLGADAYWLKTVQYSGGNVRSEDKAGLYPLVNLVTDLDTQFWQAYRNGILLLPDTNQLEETEKLIQKAETNMPERWEPLYAGGFYYYFYKNDYDTAIEKYKKCTEISGCLAGAERMIRNLETRRGKYSIAIEQYLAEIQNPEISDDDYDLFRKKVEESAKLLVLNDGAQQFIASEKNSGKHLEKLSDLEGFLFTPSIESQKVIGLLENNKSLFDFTFTLQNNQVLVDKNTLLPAFEVNEMEWSSEENRVRTRIF